MPEIKPDAGEVGSGDVLSQASRLHPSVTTGFLGVPPTVENSPKDGSLPGPASQVMPLGHTNDPRTAPRASTPSETLLQ